MNKSQRISFSEYNTDDAHIKVRLEQDVDTIEFLSMDITTEDAYADFNSDYGVVVGRVIANGGIGVPNAKISVFIPLSEEDEQDSVMRSLYPYKTPKDINNDGKRYNLLPRISCINSQTGIIEPKQAFGSFPLREEIITDMSLMNMYKKYYKYSTRTNASGDYMIFGVPVGTQTLHVSVDITDIGEYSMSPAAMINDLGYSPNLFNDEGSQIKPSTDLNDLPNIETQEMTIDVIPFWGDIENFEIGITKQDFRIRSHVSASFVLFASIFTDSADSVWAKEIFTNPLITELYLQNNANTITLNTARSGTVYEDIYYYPNKFTDDDIDAGNVDPYTDMKLLDKSDYTAYKRKGDIVVVVNCNRNKVIINERGEKIRVADDSPFGVFTEFRGFITIRFSNSELPMSNQVTINSQATSQRTCVQSFRYKLKFPQHALEGKSFAPDGYGNISQTRRNNNTWRNQNFRFCYNKFYTLSKFHSIVCNDYSIASHANAYQFPVKSNGFFKKDCVNTVSALGSVGTLITNCSTSGNMVSNVTYSNCQGFAMDWLNIGIYLQQNSYAYVGASWLCFVYNNSHFQPSLENNAPYNYHYLYSNNQHFVAGEKNPQSMPRSDLNWTAIVEVPREDIIVLAGMSSKGYELPSNSNVLIGDKYRNCHYIPLTTDAASGCDNTWNCAVPPLNLSTSTTPTSTYFFKGAAGSDVIEFLTNLCLV